MTLRRGTLVDPSAAIAVAGVGLLVVQWAAARPLWLDEELLAINLRDRGILTYFEPLWLGQSVPFGWLAIERLVVIAFGAGERALRCLPVLFGIGTLAAAVWIGRRWMTAAGRTALVILCAGSQWLTFYFLELKSYSADAFFALLLPAIAAWSVESAGLKPCATTTQGDSTPVAQAFRLTAVAQAFRLTAVAQAFRPATFWIVAAIAQWFANGALFVTPLCALMIAAMLARRNEWRSAALPFLLSAAVWIGSLALNYFFVLRHAQSSAYLQSFWAFAFPPPPAGAAGTLQWLGTQLAAFGVKPGSTRFGVLLWIAAAAGFAAGAMRRRSASLFFATVPPAAMLLAVLRLVPLYERLTLWMVPALYVGVAFLADAAWSVFVSGRSEDRPATPLAALGLGVAILICGDVVVLGVPAAVLRAGARHENRGHDDRAAVRWLMSHEQPGDVWMTTHYGVPAIWWYAGVEGRRIIEVTDEPEPAACRHDNLTAAVADAPRVLLYLGFRYDDAPRGFDDRLVGRLSQLGSVTSFRPFADDGNALVIDRRVAPGAPTTLSRLHQRPTDAPAAIDGCFAVRVADIPTFVR